MPLVVIIAAANTVSRASDAVSGPPETISVTIKAPSITVTATASTSEPNGSPTRWATTSAWWTALSTAAARNAPAITRTIVPGLLPQVAAVSTAATAGTTVVQRGVLKRALQDGSPSAASRRVVGSVGHAAAAAAPALGVVGARAALEPVGARAASEHVLAVAAEQAVGAV